MKGRLKNLKTGFQTALYIAPRIVALRNEKGSYNYAVLMIGLFLIVALRNEKGSYNLNCRTAAGVTIVALRNEKGSYNQS